MASLQATLYAAMLLAFALTCLSLAQAAIYFLHSGRKDGLWLRVLVASLCVLDCFHQVWLCQAIYFWSILHNNEPEMLDRIPDGIYGQAAVSAVIALLVQGFYIQRMRLLAKNAVYYLIPIAILSVCQAAFLGVYLYKQSVPDRMSGIVGDVANWAHVVNAVTAATDMSIACVMIWLLLRGRTGFRRTDSILFRLVVYCFMSGAATSITALLVIFTLAAIPETNLFWLFYFTLPKAYINSCLLLLNQRDSLRQMGSSGVDWSEPANHGVGSNHHGVSLETGLARPHVVVKMETFTQVDKDSSGPSEDNGKRAASGSGI